MKTKRRWVHPAVVGITQPERLGLLREPQTTRAQKTLRYRLSEQLDMTG
jgi:hypothetical protein